MKASGITAALKAYRAATNNDVVSAEEVLRRSAVCRAGWRGKPCPKLADSVNFTNKASKRLGQLSGEHGVPKEIADKSCGVCGCSMLLLLPALPENLHKDSPDERAHRPSFCWLPAATK